MVGTASAALGHRYSCVALDILSQGEGMFVITIGAASEGIALVRSSLLADQHRISRPIAIGVQHLQSRQFDHIDLSEGWDSLGLNAKCKVHSA